MVSQFFDEAAGIKQFLLLPLSHSTSTSAMVVKCRY